MTRRMTLLAAMVVALVPMAARAQAPSFMPIQGFLTDAEGAPVDGDTTLTFSLYVNYMDATPVYSEDQVVLVEDGFFTVYLGQIEALDLGMFTNSAPKFLGLKVGTEEEMTPRLALGSVPYAAFAQNAGDAQTLGGMSAQDFRASGEGISWADLNDVPAGLDDGDADALGGLSCAEGQVAKYDATGGAWICGGDIDSVLSESEIDVMVGNNGYALAADLATVAMSGSFTDLTNVPADNDTLGILACTDGQVVKWDNGEGEWVCADDANDYTDTDTLADLNCADGQLAKRDGANAVWACASDIDTGFSTEVELTGLLDDNYLPIAYLPAWGDLTGMPSGFSDGIDNDSNTTYAAGSGLGLSGTTFYLRINGVTASHIAADAVGTSELADNSVGSANVIDGSITGADVADSGLTSADMANEPGVEYTNFLTNFDPTATQTSAASVNVAWPASGFVVAMASVQHNCSAGTNVVLQLRFNGSTTTDWVNYAGADGYQIAPMVNNTFSVGGTGSSNLELLVSVSPDTCSHMRVLSLVGMYFPTRY